MMNFPLSVIIDGFMATVRDTGMWFGCRKKEDADMRFRIQSPDGVLQWGNGKDAPDKALGPVIVTDNEGTPLRCLFEFNGPRGLPVGITLTDMAHGDNNVMSLTAESGKLIIRNESTGRVIQEIN